MNKHARSILLSTSDPYSASFNRSFTPVLVGEKRFILPNISQDTKFLNTYKISFEKKYSILKVPKIKEVKVLSENNKDLKITTEVYPPIEISPITPIHNLKSKSSRISLAKICKMKKICRSRQNPNQENLKAQLEILKTQKHSAVKTPETTNHPEDNRSDIEKLLESQVSFKFLRNSSLKKENPIKIYKKISLKQEDYESILERSNDSISSQSNCGAKSQTPTNKMISSINCKIKTDSFNSAYKKNHGLNREKDYKQLIMARSSDKPLVGREKYDYQLESLKILKNTAFFAEKIMKNIRCGGKVKSVSKSDF
jgi:hypothetical protein